VVVGGVKPVVANCLTKYPPAVNVSAASVPPALVLAKLYTPVVAFVVVDPTSVSVPDSKVPFEFVSRYSSTVAPPTTVSIPESNEELLFTSTKAVPEMTAKSIAIRDLPSRASTRSRRRVRTLADCFELTSAEVEKLFRMRCRKPLIVPTPK
jgi:hypothetical protein